MITVANILISTIRGTVCYLLAALMEVPVVADPSTAADLSAEEAFLLYETSMSQLVDRFLPLRLVTIRRCPRSLWFDRECRSMRRQARHHERKYRRTGLPSDRLTWVQFATCTGNIAKRREHTGKTEYHLTLRNRSVCGPHSTPSWVVAVAAQVTLQRSRPLQPTISWLRTPPRSLAYAVPRKMLLLLITRPLTVVCPL